MNWHSLFFLFFAILTCGFAFAVLFTSNVVRMAFYLTLCLGSASGLFFLAGADFVGAMQFMIYVGGTLVLLIFGVMLTAQQRFISMETKPAEWIIAAIVGSALLLMLVNAGFSNRDWTQTRDKSTVTVEESLTASPLGLALSGVRVDQLRQQDPVLRRGMSGYLLPFVIVSMHLLTVLIGAGYMARTKRRATSLLVRTAAARPTRKHGFFAMVGLVKGLVINLVAAAFCFSGVLTNPKFAGEGAVGDFLQKVAALPSWVLPALGLLFLVNALLIGVVFSWQKWGAIGLLVVPLIQGMVLHNGGAPTIAVAVFVLLAIVPALALMLILTSFGKPETAWSQME